MHVTKSHLALADDNGGHHLLAELGLALLDGGHDHVAGGGLRVAVEAATDVANGDDVEVLGASVVSTVDDGGRGKTSGDLVLDAGSEGASALSFLSHFS